MTQELLFGDQSGSKPRPNPDPRVVLRHQENTKTLTALVKIPNLTTWERYFVRELVTHKNISRRQQESLDQLRDKYLTKGETA